MRCRLWVAIVLASAAFLYAAETPIPSSPTQWVTDTANFLSPEAVQSLNARLAAYEQATGHQIIVYIAPTTGDAPIEDWAVRAFAKWKVGRKGLDDGLALFIMPQDRKMRIEVGYGLEPVVPDAIASRVINEVMAPRLQAGQHDQAVTAAVDSLTGVIGGQSPTRFHPRGRRPQPKPLSPFQLIFYGFIGILILGFLDYASWVGVLFSGQHPFRRRWAGGRGGMAEEEAADLAGEAGDPAGEGRADHGNHRQGSDQTSDSESGEADFRRDPRFRFAAFLGRCAESRREHIRAPGHDRDKAAQRRLIFHRAGAA